jgi:hypothetical protein
MERQSGTQDLRVRTGGLMFYMTKCGNALLVSLSKQVSNNQSGIALPPKLRLKPDNDVVFVGVTEAFLRPRVYIGQLKW